MKIGYARVSTEDQNLARQLEQLHAAGVEKIYEEKISGKDRNRPQLAAMLSYIHDHDVVTVVSLDRLGRSSKDLTTILDQIRSKGATIDILDLPSFAGVTDENLRSLLTNLVIDIYKYTAEEERRKIKSRQREGIEIAKKNGVYTGAVRQYSKNGSKRFLYNSIVKMLQEGASIAQISRHTNVTRQQIYRIKAYAIDAGDLEDRGTK